MSSALRVATTVGSGLGGVRFNERVIAGLEAQLGDELEVVRVAPARSAKTPGVRRLPMGAVNRLPGAGIALLGRSLWGTKPTHRLDIRLPPAEHEVVTVLDLAPIHFTDEGSVPHWALPSIRRSRGALCLSPTVAEEVEQLADIPTWITGAGCDQRFFDAVPLAEDTLVSLGITGPFVLSIGGTTERKNLALVRDSWPHIRREADLTLVSVGPDAPGRRALFAETPRTVVLDQVADETVPGLMASSAALVVPSLYEGFGMPVIEGMAAGVPVVAANRSSLPWVAGEAGILVEPEAMAFAAGVMSALEPDDRDRRVTAGQARARKFTWDAVVQAHLTAYSTAF